MAILNIPITNVQPLNTLLTGISQLGYSGNAGLFLKVNATENGFEFSAAGSSGVSIGDTIGGGTAGSVLFLGASGVLAQDNTNFFWDDTNNRLGIGTNTPAQALDVNGYMRLGLSGSSYLVSRTDNQIMVGADSNYYLFSGSGITSNLIIIGSGRMHIDSSGNVGINNNSPSAKLHTKATTATDTVIIAQGTTAQTGNLFEARNVGGSVLFSMSPTNNFGIGIAAASEMVHLYKSGTGNCFFQIDRNGSTNYFGVGDADYMFTGIGSGDFGIRSSGALFFGTGGNNVRFKIAQNGTTTLYQSLCFEGNTSSFPAIKRNGTQIDIRLADDSAYADLAIGNLVSNTGSGIQLATATSQKIAFWGATPIVQPTTAITAATYASVSGSFVKASDTFDGYSIGQVVKALRNEGLLA